MYELMKQAVSFYFEAAFRMYTYVLGKEPESCRITRQKRFGGGNVCGQQEILRENHFGGEFRHEIDEIEQQTLIPPNHKEKAASFETADVLTIQKLYAAFFLKTMRRSTAPVTRMETSRRLFPSTPV